MTIIFPNDSFYMLQLVS